MKTDQDIWTQTSLVPADEGCIVSVLLNSRKWEADGEIGPSDRRVVYDGVVHIGDQWTFTLENKPHSDVWEGQLHPGIDDTEEVEIDPYPVVLVWKELISRFHDFDHRRWLNFTQRELLEDFFLYVLKDFSYLNPYPTFSACKDNVGLLNHRCQAIMQEMLLAA